MSNDPGHEWDACQLKADASTTVGNQRRLRDLTNQYSADNKENIPPFASTPGGSGGLWRASATPKRRSTAARTASTASPTAAESMAALMSIALTPGHRMESPFATTTTALNAATALTTPPPPQLPQTQPLCANGSTPGSPQSPSLSPSRQLYEHQLRALLSATGHLSTDTPTWRSATSSAHPRRESSLASGAAVTTSGATGAAAPAVGPLFPTQTNEWTRNASQLIFDDYAGAAAALSISVGSQDGTPCKLAGQTFASYTDLQLSLDEILRNCGVSALTDEDASGCEPSITAGAVIGAAATPSALSVGGRSAKRRSNQQQPQQHNGLTNLCDISYQSDLSATDSQFIPRSVFAESDEEEETMRNAAATATRAVGGSGVAVKATATTEHASKANGQDPQRDQAPSGATAEKTAATRLGFEELSQLHAALRAAGIDAGNTERNSGETTYSVRAGTYADPSWGLVMAGKPPPPPPPYNATATTLPKAASGRTHSTHSTHTNTKNPAAASAPAAEMAADCLDRRTGARRSHFVNNVKAAAGSLIAISGRRVPVTKLHLLHTATTPGERGVEEGNELAPSTRRMPSSNIRTTVISGNAVTARASTANTASLSAGRVDDSRQRSPALEHGSATGRSWGRQSVSPHSVLPTPTGSMEDLDATRPHVRTNTQGFHAPAAVSGADGGPSERRRPHPGIALCEPTTVTTVAPAIVPSSRRLPSAAIRVTLRPPPSTNATIGTPSAPVVNTAVDGEGSAATVAVSDSDLVVTLRFAQGRTMRFYCNSAIGDALLASELASLASANGSDGSDGCPPGWLSPTPTKAPLTIHPGRFYFARVFASRSPFDGLGYEDVGMCARVIRMRGGSIPGPESGWDQAIDGVLLRANDVEHNPEDHAHHQEWLRLRAASVSACAEQFAFLNLPFRLTKVCLTRDLRVCAVYYTIAASEDASSHPNVSRLIRDLQYRLRTKVVLCRIASEVAVQE